MHIQKVLSAIIFGTCFAVSANAAQMCFDYNFGANCDQATTEGQADWAVRCDGKPVKGFGVCSNQFGQPGSTSDTLSASGEEGDVYCWCKMTHPAISKFVHVGNNGSYTIECAQHCGGNCAREMTGRSSTVKSGIYSSLTY